MSALNVLTIVDQNNKLIKVVLNVEDKIAGFVLMQDKPNETDYFEIEYENGAWPVNMVFIPKFLQTIKNYVSGHDATTIIPPNVKLSFAFPSSICEQTSDE